MGLFDKITAKNFNAFAQKHYDDFNVRTLRTSMKTCVGLDI